MGGICPSLNCSDCGFRSTVFSSLTNDQLEKLTAGKTFKSVPKGTIMAGQGGDINGFIFLRLGLAKLTRTTDNGREQIVGIATPNDFVGLLSLFSSKVYQYSIIAIEDSEYCCVDYGIVKKLIDENGAFAHSLLEKICRVSDVLINTRLDLDLRQLRGRVAFIINYFANEVYLSKKFNLPISRKEIAELIDMRVENVVRILSEFRKDNIIRIEGTTIEIVDEAKLKWVKDHG
ncbi:MAG: Crp/Fnr family transcriptional regulator [Bacteroidales bacterium]